MSPAVGGEASSHRASVLSACVAALDVVAAVQNLTSRDDEASDITAAVDSVLDAVADALWRLHACDVASALLLPCLHRDLRRMATLGGGGSSGWHLLSQSVAETCAAGVLPLLLLLAEAADRPTEPAMTSSSALDPVVADAFTGCIQLLTAAADVLGRPLHSMLPEWLPREPLLALLQRLPAPAVVNSSSGGEDVLRDGRSLFSQTLACEHDQATALFNPPFWLSSASFRSLFLSALETGILHTLSSSSSAADRRREHVNPPALEAVVTPVESAHELNLPSAAAPASLPTFAPAPANHKLKATTGSAAASRSRLAAKRSKSVGPTRMAAAGAAVRGRSGKPGSGNAKAVTSKSSASAARWHSGPSPPRATVLLRPRMLLRARSASAIPRLAVGLRPRAHYHSPPAAAAAAPHMHARFNSGDGVKESIAAAGSDIRGRAISRPSASSSSSVSAGRQLPAPSSAVVQAHAAVVARPSRLADSRGAPKSVAAAFQPQPPAEGHTTRVPSATASEVGLASPVRARLRLGQKAVSAPDVTQAGEGGGVVAPLTTAQRLRRPPASTANVIPVVVRPLPLIRHSHGTQTIDHPPPPAVPQPQAVAVSFGTGLRTHQPQQHPPLLLPSVGAEDTVAASLAVAGEDPFFLSPIPQAPTLSAAPPANLISVASVGGMLISPPPQPFVPHHRHLPPSNIGSSSGGGGGATFTPPRALRATAANSTSSNSYRSPLSPSHIVPATGMRAVDVVAAVLAGRRDVLQAVTVARSRAALATSRPRTLATAGKPQRNTTTSASAMVNDLMSPGQPSPLRAAAYPMDRAAAVPTRAICGSVGDSPGHLPSSAPDDGDDGADNEGPAVVARLSLQQLRLRARAVLADVEEAASAVNSVSSDSNNGAPSVPAFSDVAAANASSNSSHDIDSGGAAKPVIGMQPRPQPSAPVSSSMVSQLSGGQAPLPPSTSSSSAVSASIMTTPTRPASSKEASPTSIAAPMSDGGWSTTAPNATTVKGAGDHEALHEVDIEPAVVAALQFGGSDGGDDTGAPQMIQSPMLFTTAPVRPSPTAVAASAPPSPLPIGTQLRPPHQLLLQNDPPLTQADAPSATAVLSTPAPSHVHVGGSSSASGSGNVNSPLRSLAALTSERGARLASLRARLDAVLQVAHTSSSAAQ